MDANIKVCISSRRDMFEKYYSVPQEAKADVEKFISDIERLGEESLDVADFEAKFATNGYQEMFTALLMRCVPKPYKMTKEEKAEAKETAKEIFKEDRSRIVKEAAEEALDYVSVMAEEELIAQTRKDMIEAGVYDDYTRATNALDMMQDVGGFIKKVFKKK